MWWERIKNGEVHEISGRELEVNFTLSDEEAVVLAASIRRSSLVEVRVWSGKCGEVGYLALVSAIVDSGTVEAAWIDSHNEAVRAAMGAAVGRLLGAGRPQLALFFAATCGDADGVREAVRAGADMERTCFSRRPLYIASWAGHDSAVRCLVEGGADIDATSVGMTALHGASWMGRLPVVRYLAEHGASLEAETFAGWTPLDLATWMGHHLVAEYLVRKAKIDAATRDGTLLHLAIQEENLDEMRNLLEGGADVDAVDRAGATALSMACEKGYFDMVDVLLAAGARRYGRRSVVDVALQRGGEMLVAVKRGLASARAPDEKYAIARRHIGNGGLWTWFFGPGPLEDKTEAISWMHQAKVDGHPAAQAEYEKLCMKATGALKLVRNIARGAFGEVWVGEQWGRTVAVKVPSDAPSAVSDLLNETARLGALPAHENVVRFYYSGEKDRRAMLVMEYVEGGDARSVLDKSMARRMEVAMAIAHGMAHLHLNSVAHLDLKLENVLVGKDGSVKVTDFGTALQFKRQANGTFSVVGQEFARGTYEYADPQVFAEEQIIIPNRADVYAFGIMLYELATGQRARYSEWEGVGDLTNKPWDHHARICALFVDIHDNGYRPFIPSNVPVWLSTLIHECWHSDLKLRPSFPEIIERLENGG